MTRFESQGLDYPIQDPYTLSGPTREPSNRQVAASQRRGLRDRVLQVIFPSPRHWPSNGWTYTSGAARMLPRAKGVVVFRVIFPAPRPRLVQQEVKLGPLGY